ncbi:MAG: hypothetical protein PHI06_12750 [Desulfobulbaceae bacterium]|nr:hypothetical protein [Desulfobulbaceae bacterium]
MQKLTTIVPTGNKTLSKRVAVTIATVFVSGALLWLGATIMSSKPIVIPQASFPLSIDEAISAQRTNHNDQFELRDQIIITYADSEKVSRQAIAFQEFKKEIASATQDLNSSAAGVNDIVERLTSLKTCISLTYLMAKGLFIGGSPVNEIFLAEAGEVDHITSTSVRKATQAIERLHATLKIIEDSYTETYIVGPETEWVATDIQDEASGRTSARDMKQLELTKTIAFDSTFGSASALLSATALAKTASSSAWNLFGVVEKKAANRMALAALPAIADGPLPIGDMVAIALESGCLAWSFHEVYEAQRTIKNDLHRELSSVMKQNSNHIREWAMTVGNELMEVAALSRPAPKGKAAIKAHPRK